LKRNPKQDQSSANFFSGDGVGVCGDAEGVDEAAHAGAQSAAAMRRRRMPPYIMSFTQKSGSSDSDFSF
jgi:hypothetical protein